MRELDAVDLGLDLQRRGRAPLNLDAAQLAELANELAPLVEGAELAKLCALPPRDVLLVFQRADDSFVRRVRLSAHPEAARLHLQHERVELHEGPIGPFYRRLGEELVHARCKRVASLRGDRVVRFEFVETPSGRSRTLLAEFFGRRANLLLLDGDDRVLEVLVAGPSDRPDTRSTPGSIWRAPPPREKSASSKSIVDAFPEPPPAPRGATEAPLSWRIESALGAHAVEFDRERLAKELLDRVARKLERARSLVNGLVARLESGERAERVKQDGELIKANLAAIPRGANEIELADFFSDDGALRRVALDPKKRAMENAESYFERYRKLLRSRETVAGELERARAKLSALEELDRAARAATSDPAALEASAIDSGLLEPRQIADPKKRKAPEPRKPYRVFRGSRGSEIRVGKNAADNDELTLHHARGNDVWLHTSDTPGSHVVLVLAGRPEPDAEEVLDAAHLAAHFSPLREAARVRVHVARRKEVHKPRGAKPGLVHLSGGKILDLRLQPERVQRLLQTARAGPAESDSD